MQIGQAARQALMTRQTLRDWVRRYNAEGIDGLRDRSKGHAKRMLTPKQDQQIAALVPRGHASRIMKGTLVCWRCVDLQDVIRERFGVVYHARSVGTILRRLGFSRLSVRPLSSRYRRGARYALWQHRGHASSPVGNPPERRAWRSCRRHYRWRQLAQSHDLRVPDNITPRPLPPLSMSLKKLLDFFDSDMLQLFDFELRPYRSNDSI